MLTPSSICNLSRAVGSGAGGAFAFAGGPRGCCWQAREVVGAGGCSGPRGRGGCRGQAFAGKHARLRRRGLFWPEGARRVLLPGLLLASTRGCGRQGGLRPGFNPVRGSGFSDWADGSDTRRTADGSDTRGAPPMIQIPGALILIPDTTNTMKTF